MEKSSMQIWARIILAFCGAALIAVLFVPIWRIDLDAPQYPEGLRMLIYAKGLAGNVDIINGLNHYIGMKTLHSKDFIEFTVLPYLIGIFAFLFLGVAAMGNRKLMFTLFALFVSFGVLAMVDFWRWEYNYGHNLNPEAAIIVPGMTYQPPLIGYKQLLNFGAYSVPDIGGWIFVSVGVLFVVCIVPDIVMAKKRRKRSIPVAGVAVASLIMLFLLSCNTAPEAIKIGSDQCQFCKMSISDRRFGAEIITTKGKVLKFDEGHCMHQYLDANINTEVKSIYLTDFCGSNELIPKQKCRLLKSVDLRSPMGGNVAAFSIEDSMKYYAQTLNGTVISWEEM
ncbi:MAG: nitrous oxide reductase accessory protein NosL [Bacteroidetes bacterium]|nr:nitrous oxide reductase accessory protein NosL [Bacteroidota bacterium]